MNSRAADAVVPRKLVRGDVAHTFRASLFSKEQRFVLSGSELQWSDRKGEHRVPLSAIGRVHIYEAPGSGRTIRRTVLRLEDGRKLLVQSNHFVRIGTFEDRAETYWAFLAGLLERLPAAKPGAQVLVGTPRGLWLIYLILLITSGLVLIAGGILWIVGDFPVSAAVTFGLLLTFWPLCWRVVRGGAARAVSAAVARDSLPD